MENGEVVSIVASSEESRDEYSAPEIRNLGNVREITLGGNGGGTDLLLTSAL
jgi:hypothetical protein